MEVGVEIEAVDLFAAIVGDTVELVFISDKSLSFGGVMDAVEMLSAGILVEIVESLDLAVGTEISFMD